VCDSWRRRIFGRGAAATTAGALLDAEVLVATRSATVRGTAISRMPSSSIM